MTDAGEVMEVLLVEDNEEHLAQFRELAPEKLGEIALVWDYCPSFNEAIQRIKYRHYDMIVSDIYMDRAGIEKTIEDGDARVREVLEALRKNRFCPVTLMSDGALPADLIKEPFVNFFDKSAANWGESVVTHLQAHLDSGVPSISRKLHDELDRYTGSYIWGFLMENWVTLEPELKKSPDLLERIIRRRAALSLDRIDGGGEEPKERETATGADYYIVPPISKSLRLGSIMRRNKDKNDVRVVLTPHCYLELRGDKALPKTDLVLTAGTQLAAEFLEKLGKEDKDFWGKDSKRAGQLHRRTDLPSKGLSIPEGRYCFLPGFLEIKDMYCDLLALESMEYVQLTKNYTQIAVLDRPYAEALQSCLLKLYSSVGTPDLDRAHFEHLLPK